MLTLFLVLTAGVVALWLATIGAAAAVRWIVTRRRENAIRREVAY